MILTSLSLLALAAPPASDHHVFALRATRVHVGDGTVLERGVVVIEDGKIRSVSAEAPEGTRVVSLEGDLSAGLVGLRDFSGVGGEGYDSTRNVVPEADLSFAFDPRHSDAERLLREGVTTVVVTPRSGSLVGGLCAVVKPASQRVLKRRGHLWVSLSADGLRFDTYPTSYPSAIEELDRLFGEGGGTIGAAAKGELPVMLEAESNAELQRALAFAKRHGLKGALIGPQRAGELASAVKASGLGVVLGPYGVGTERRTLASAAQLAAAGVPIAFAVDAPARHPAQLRFSAAVAMREGLDAAAAWRALTADAARIAGVQDSVGTLAKGKDADLVLWSGPPTELASRVLQVYVDGELRFEEGKD